MHPDDQPQQPIIEAPSAPPPEAQQPQRTTASKLFGLLVIVVCFEVGIFLLVFPWMDAWRHNWLASQAVWLMDLFESNYFRGALSGLGIINVYISFAEMIRLLRG